MESLVIRHPPTVSLQVRGQAVGRRAAARFAGPPESWLPAGAEPRGRGRWQLTLSLGGMHRGVLLELGDVWRHGGGTWRSCAWRPQEERGDWLPGPVWLPAFHGSVGVLVDQLGGASLALEGTYTPPFGRAGRLVDRLLLGRLARRSARELLAALAPNLDDQPGYMPREASLALRSAR